MPLPCNDLQFFMPSESLTHDNGDGCHVYQNVKGNHPVLEQAANLQPADRSRHVSTVFMAQRVVTNLYEEKVDQRKETVQAVNALHYVVSFPVLAHDP
jgi:hypothetical protein